MPTRHSAAAGGKFRGLYEALREQGNSNEKAARIVKAATNSARAQPAPIGRLAGDYEDMTKNDLYSRARRIGIDGRSRMTKSELISALRNH